MVGLSCKLFFIVLVVFLCREAAVLDESALRCVQPAARYFFLGEKVPKTPHKGIPLMNPLKQNDSYPFYFRHYLIEKANRLPRSPAPAVRNDILCLYFGVPNSKAGTGRLLQSQGTPKKRQKAAVYNRAAAERGKRSAFPGGRADNRKGMTDYFKREG